MMKQDGVEQGISKGVHGPRPSMAISIGAWAILAIGVLLLALSVASGVQILLKLVNFNVGWSDNPVFALFAAVATIVVSTLSVFAGIRRALGGEAKFSNLDLEKEVDRIRTRETRVDLAPPPIQIQTTSPELRKEILETLKNRQKAPISPYRAGTQSQTHE